MQTVGRATDAQIVRCDDLAFRGATSRKNRLTCSQAPILFGVQYLLVARAQRQRYHPHAIDESFELFWIKRRLMIRKFEFMIEGEVLLDQADSDLRRQDAGKFILCMI